MQPTIAGIALQRFTNYPVSSIFLDRRLRGIRRPGLVFLKMELSGLEKDSEAQARKGARVF